MWLGHYFCCACSWSCGELVSVPGHAVTSHPMSARAQACCLCWVPRRRTHFHRCSELMGCFSSLGHGENTMLLLGEMRLGWLSSGGVDHPLPMPGPASAGLLTRLALLCLAVVRAAPCCICVTSACRQEWSSPALLPSEKPQCLPTPEKASWNGLGWNRPLRTSSSSLNPSLPAHH